MRTIDADILKDKLDWVIDNPYIESSLGEQIIRTIDNAPTVERPNGEWEKVGGVFYQLKCSNCNFELKSPDDKSNFCPCCGADMRNKEGDGNEV